MASKYEEIGKRIRKFRKEANFTQEQLAEKARIDPKSVVEIEAGKRNPTVKTLSKIASALKITLPNLMSGKQK